MKPAAVGFILLGLATLGLGTWAIVSAMKKEEEEIIIDPATGYRRAATPEELALLEGAAYEPDTPQKTDVMGDTNEGWLAGLVSGIMGDPCKRKCDRQFPGRKWRNERFNCKEACA